MLLEALAALSVGPCLPLSEGFRDISISFPEGTAELSEQDRRHIEEAVKPIIGDALAEVQVRGYFLYGSRPNLFDSRNGDAPGHTGDLTEMRVGHVREAAIQFGISPDLVGSVESAVGEGGMYSASPERLNTVELQVRIKTDCHPLADLARRLSPYD